MLLDKKGLFIARSISKNLISFKQKISTGGNIKKTLKIKNSKIFIGYYVNDVRLIDNF